MKMFWDSIAENRQWIFDGIGLLVITSIAGAVCWLWRRWRKSQSSQPVEVVATSRPAPVEQSSSVEVPQLVGASQNVAAGVGSIQHIQTIQITNQAPAPQPLSDGLVCGYSTSPSPIEIRDDLESARKPFQSALIEKQYRGLKVAWKLSYESVSLLSDDRVMIYMHLQNPPDNRFLSISCTVPLQSCPRVMSAPKGHLLLVYGEIESLSPYEMSLRKAKVIFD